MPEGSVWWVERWVQVMCVRCVRFNPCVMQRTNFDEKIYAF